MFISQEKSVKIHEEYFNKTISMDLCVIDNPSTKYRPASIILCLWIY